MRTSSGSGILPTVGRSKLYYAPAAEREIHAQPAVAESGKYDSVTLSSNGSSDTYKTMVGRLTQEVLTATTTGDIKALRRQVSAGTYEPNPSVIAARMLFIGEGV